MYSWHIHDIYGFLVVCNAVNHTKNDEFQIFSEEQPSKDVIKLNF